LIGIHALEEEVEGAEKKTGKKQRRWRVAAIFF